MLDKTGTLEGKEEKWRGDKILSMSTGLPSY